MSETRSRRRSAAIVGTDSCSNLGDQAILKTLARLLRARGYDELHVRSYRSDIAAERLDSIDPTSVGPMPWREVSGRHHLSTIGRTSARFASARLSERLGGPALFPPVDLAVLVGGRYLQSPFFSAFWNTALTAQYFADRSVPVVLAPQTIGPAATMKEKVALSLILSRADIVMARDRESTDFLRHFGVRGPEYLDVPDVVYAFEAASPAEAEHFLTTNGVQRSGRPLLLVADRVLSGTTNAELHAPDDHLAKFAASLDELSCHYDCVFLSSTYATGSYRRNDPQQGVRIRQRMSEPERLTVIDQEPTAEILKACYGRADAVLTTRMHPIIMASSVGTPVVSLAYEAKNRGQTEAIGHPEWAFDIGSEPAEVVSMVRRNVDRGQPLRSELLDVTGRLAGDVEEAFDRAIDLTIGQAPDRSTAAPMTRRGSGR